VNPNGKAKIMTFPIQKMAIWQARKSYIHGLASGKGYIYILATCHPMILVKTAIFNHFFPCLILWLFWDKVGFHKHIVNHIIA
jgi:hypothetical protein